MSSVTSALEIFAAIIVIILIFTYYGVTKNHKKRDKYLLGMTICQLTVLITDIIGILYEHSGNTLLVKIMWGFNYPALLCEIILFHLYLKAYLKRNFKKIFKQDTYFLIAIAAIASGMWIYSLFTNTFFIIAPDGYFSQNAYYSFVELPPLLMFLYDIFLILVHAKAFNIKDLLIWLTFGTIPIVSRLIDNYYGVDILYPAMTISVLMVYIDVFIARVRESYINAIELSEKNLELENTKIKVTMSQIRPHFLYNVLSSIMAIKGNPKETKDAIADFSNYLRKNLDSVNLNTSIPFTNELNHVKLYVRLEKLRFEDEVNVEYDIKYDNFEIPALCLQMLVENAIKHGISCKRGGGTVKVSTRKYKDEYLVTVKDDGIGFDTTKPLSEDRSHIGLDSIDKRLKYMINGSLSIDSKLGVGTKATIHIPIKENK